MPRRRSTGSCYFDGVPNMQKYMKINVGKTVPEMMQRRPRPRARRVKRLNHGIVLATGQDRQRLAGALRADPRLGGGAHRLARGPDPADQGPGPRTTWRSRSTPEDRAGRHRLRDRFRPSHASPDDAAGSFRDGRVSRIPSSAAPAPRSAADIARPEAALDVVHDEEREREESPGICEPFETPFAAQRRIVRPLGRARIIRSDSPCRN